MCVDYGRYTIVVDVGSAATDTFYTDNTWKKKENVLAMQANKQTVIPPTLQATYLI